MNPSRLLLPLVLAWLASCTNAPALDEAPATGALRLALTLPLAAPSSVSRVTVTLSGADLAPRSTQLTLTQGAWGGVLGDVPAGTGRTLFAQAFTAANVLVYTGRAEGITVTADTTGLVSLILQSVGSPDPLTNAAPVIDALVATPAVVVPGGTVSLQALAHDVDPGDVLRYTWTAPVGTFSTPNQALTTWTAPTRQEPVRLSLQVSDSRGVALTMSLNVTVSAGSGAEALDVGFNLAPRVVTLSSSRSLLDVGQRTDVSVSATDVEGDAFSYQWSATCAGTFSAPTAMSTAFTPSSPPGGACNNCQLGVKVTDARGGQTTGQVAVCVSRSEARHAAPLFTRTYQSSLTAKARQQLVFDVGASDPEGSALAFTWTAPGGTLGTASSDGANSRVTWTAPNCSRTATAPGPTATVTNAWGLTATRSFTVTGLPPCPWSMTGAMREARVDHQATALFGGKVLVSGGYNTSTGYLASAELYDPATGTWNSTGAMRAARAQSIALRLYTDKVLVIGGMNREGYQATAELYNPATGTWSSTGAMSTARFGHTAILLPDGKVLVVGGFGSSGALRTAELYDPATGTWSLTGSLSTARYSHAATLLLSGQVLVTGGSDGSFSARSDTEMYNPSTGTWSLNGSMRTGRRSHTATALSNGRVLLMGGLNDALPSSEEYDPALGTSSIAAWRTPRGAHRATPVRFDRVLISGGTNSTGDLALTEQYSPGGSWLSQTALSTARGGHTATPLQDGRVLIAGGSSQGSIIDSAEVFDPTRTP